MNDIIRSGLITLFITLMFVGYVALVYTFGPIVLFITMGVMMFGCLWAAIYSIMSE